MKHLAPKGLPKILDPLKLTSKLADKVNGDRDGVNDGSSHGSTARAAATLPPPMLDDQGTQAGMLSTRKRTARGMGYGDAYTGASFLDGDQPSKGVFQ